MREVQSRIVQGPCEGSETAQEQYAAPSPLTYRTLVEANPILGRSVPIVDGFRRPSRRLAKHPDYTRLALNVLGQGEGWRKSPQSAGSGTMQEGRREGGTTSS